VLERIADHPINRIEELLPWNLAPKLANDSLHACQAQWSLSGLLGTQGRMTHHFPDVHPFGTANCNSKRICNVLGIEIQLCC
jgi:hypothetical protein